MPSMLRNVFAELRIASKARDFTKLKSSWDVTVALPAKKIVSFRMIARLRSLTRIFSHQATAHVNNQIRRVNQLYIKYQRTTFIQLLSKAIFKTVPSRINLRRKSPMLLLGTTAFDFKRDGISDGEVQRCIEEFKILKPQTGNSHGCFSNNRPLGTLNIEEFKEHLKEEGYEPVVESDKLLIWRKREEGLANYKYKVCGTFKDVPARAFFAVQCDTEYRKKWDNLVMELNVIQKDPENDVIYWHMHYPFPMKSRDYVFVRRNLVDDESGCMVVVSHAIEHEKCPVRTGVVRVDQYMSDMVISPHRSFDENGFDYLLTYYDDPQSSFPSFVYARMAASGVHDYIDKLHKATKSLHEGSKASCAAQNSRTTDSVKHPTPVQLEQYA